MPDATTSDAPAWQEFLRAWECTGCGRLAPYEYVACPCGAAERVPRTLSGDGTVWSLTTVAREGGGDRVVALVDAADAPGIRFLATSTATDLAAGCRVELVPGRPSGDGVDPLPLVRAVSP